MFLVSCVKVSEVMVVTAIFPNQIQEMRNFRLALIPGSSGCRRDGTAVLASNGSTHEGLPVLPAPRASQQSGIFGIIACLALALFLGACSGNAEQSATKLETPKLEPQQDLTQAVRAITTKTGVLYATRTATGTLEAKTDSNVASQISGRVVKVLRREGERVKAGEVIVRLEDSELRNQLENANIALQTARVNLETAKRQAIEATTQARSGLISAQSALVTARQAFAANENLYAIQGVSRADLNVAETNLKRAQADQIAANDAVARAGRAGQENLKLLVLQIEQAQNQARQIAQNLAKTSVKAPFSGVLTDLIPQVGETVSQDAKVFRLVDTGTLRVKFGVPLNDAQRLPVGTGVKLTITGRSLQAIVSQNANTTGENRLVMLRARFVNPCGSSESKNCQKIADLGVGTVAQARYDLRLAKGTMLPSAALTTDGVKTFAYLISSGTVAKIEVQTLAESNGQTVVRGLNANLRVVFPIPAGLRNATKVRVVGGEK
jgi:HlyD family secretion protein